MGPELALLMMAGGTGLSIAGQQQAANERRDMLNRAMTRTDQTTGRANDMLLGEGANYAADKRAQAMQQQADTNLAQSNTDLRGAGATDEQGNAIINTSGDAGAVSGDFLKAKADKALSEGQRLSAIAQQLSRVRAPGQVAANDAQRRAGVQGDIGSMWSTTGNLNRATELDAQNVQEPWWGQLGKVAAMVGSAAGGMPGAGLGMDAGLSGMQLGEMGARAASGLDFASPSGGNWWGKGARIKFGT